jgi:hypothetical protein
MSAKYYVSLKSNSLQWEKLCLRSSHGRYQIHSGVLLSRSYLHPSMIQIKSKKESPEEGVNRSHQGRSLKALCLFCEPVVSSKPSQYERFGSPSAIFTHFAR